MNKKNLLIFFGGLVTGGVVGVFGTGLYFKKKYEKMANEEIENIRQYYFSREAYIEKKRRETSEEEIEEKDGTSREDGPLSPEARAEIREKLKRNREWAEKQTTNYAGIYAEKHGKEEEADPAEMEFPTEEDMIDEKSFERHQEMKDKDPELLTAEEVGNIPLGVESKTLFFYVYDETLTDEEDEVIEDPELAVGKEFWEAMNTDGMNERIDNIIENDKTPILYIMNYAHDTLYEIQVLEASFAVNQYGEEDDE